jgi:hypothetical protein
MLRGMLLALTGVGFFMSPFLLLIGVPRVSRKALGVTAGKVAAVIGVIAVFLIGLQVWHAHVDLCAADPKALDCDTSWMLVAVACGWIVVSSASCLPSLIRTFGLENSNGKR